MNPICFHAQKAIKELGGTDGQTKARIYQASRLAGLAYWRAFDIWYGKARQIGSEEQYKILGALEKKRTVSARGELHELKTRIARLEALLASTDENFHSETLVALRSSPLRTD